MAIELTCLGCDNFIPSEEGCGGVCLGCPTNSEVKDPTNPPCQAMLGQESVLLFFIPQGEGDLRFEQAARQLRATLIRQALTDTTPYQV